jgi:bifunctional non-homologous end joining protein LigD
VLVRNLDKVLWPQGGFTKADYLAYLRAVAPVLLPHLRDRPLVLTRYPEGADGPWFYQKNVPPGAPAWLQRFPFRHGDRVVEYLLCHDEAALLWLGTQAALEFHPWLSRRQHPDQPDLAVIDLDPMPPAGFDEARQVALVVRDLLGRVGLEAWPKTSGATGVHLYLPLIPRYSFREVAEAVRRLGRVLLRLWPERVTLERPVARRAGRVYVDYLQNARGKTLVSVYCPRPLPGAPVSTPVSWGELRWCAPGAFTLATVPDRVRRLGDLFADVLRLRQPLEPLVAACDALLDRVGIPVAPPPPGARPSDGAAGPGAGDAAVAATAPARGARDAPDVP